MLLKLALFFHIISAIFWIGGMLFLTLVVAPYLKSVPDPAQKSKIYQEVGRRYRFWGWVAIITLLITGPVILHALYGIAPQEIFSAPFHVSPFGRTLAIKLGFVLLIVATSLLHDFWLGPGARIKPGLSRYAKVFGRGNLVIALVIVIFAVIMRAGGL